MQANHRPRLPGTISISEKYGPAMSVTTQAEADAYFEVLVAHCMGLGNDRGEAEEIERTSIGYFAGYFPHEVRARVEKLFRCQHPVFGAIAVNGPPTAQQAYEAGCRIAKQMLREAL
jgi:hypothetical protein